MWKSESLMVVSYLVEKVIDSPHLYVWMMVAGKHKNVAFARRGHLGI